MKTLLSKTRAKFITCLVVIFVLATPLFYLITRNFYAEDMADIIEAVERGQNIPPLDLEQDIMAGMMIQFLLVFVAVSLSFYITVRFIMRRLWLPFDDTLRKTEQFNITQGDLPRFMETDVREFDRLNRSLTKLMQKDSETFRIQKEFSENASHELQTPLAVMRSKLDLLMQEEMNQRQAQLVSDLYGLTMRMSHLNRNLLLLAKIDNAQYAKQEEVELADVLSASLSLYGALLQEKPIKVEDRRTEAPRVKLHANLVLLESLLKNLIVNAIRHCAPGEAVRIVIEDRCLTVCNPASGEGPLDADSLFRRFGSGGIRKAGNGLGLSIVKAICDFHGWTVFYHFQNGEHCFVVVFGDNGKEG